jgi:hypothetical protein
MVIKKLNLKIIEKYLEVISEDLEQIKIFQKDSGQIDSNLKNNDSELDVGKISKEIHKGIKARLEREKRVLKVKVNKTIKDIFDNLEKLYKILEINKI